MYRGEGGNQQFSGSGRGGRGPWRRGGAWRGGRGDTPYSSQASQGGGDSYHRNIRGRGRQFGGDHGGRGDRGQGRDKHPPHLKGREIGLWYRNNALKAEKHLPSVEMNSEQARILDRVLDSLGNSLKKQEPRRDCGPHQVPNTKIDSLAAINGWLNRSSVQVAVNDRTTAASPTSSAATTYTRTVDGMKDTEFKRAYMDNVLANQFSDGERALKTEGGGLQRSKTMDEQLKNELLEQRQSAGYRRLLQCRQRLPSYKMQDEILQLIDRSQVVVLSGETGCGKTTQVPQFVLEREILAGRGSCCHIVCTQPRRISAITVAQRVADERGERLGGSVGYQIRLEAQRSRTCGSIMYCTTGIVLQWLQGDPLLSLVSHLVLDEIHERDMQSDFLITLAKDLLPKRPDLKVILMSATLNAKLFSDYYGGCPMIHIPGFTFPVTEYYLEDVLEMTGFEFPSPQNSGLPKWLQQSGGPRDAIFQQQVLPWISSQEMAGAMSARTAAQLRQPHSEQLTPSLIVTLLRHICRQPSGAVLVFLPGWGDISKVHGLLQEDKEICSRRTLIIPLHSLMPTTNQREVFDRPPPGVRKIVLATNIAETSITIDDIVYVIDSGYIKMTNFDKTANLATLTSEWVTRANAHQRRGRAGRVQEGVCFHLYTRIREQNLDHYPLPEILRTRLEEIVLNIKILKLGRVLPFLTKLMQSPDKQVVMMSLQLLQAINALDEDENLTPLGFHLARLPVDPLTGRMLLMAAIFSCVDPILTIAAVLAFKDPFVTPLGKEREVNAVKARLAGDTHSDHLMVVKAYDAWRASVERGNSSFCWRNFLSPSVLQQIKNMREQFFKLLKEHKFIGNSVQSSSSSTVNRQSGNVCVVRAVVASGLYPNVAQAILPRSPLPPGSKKPLKIRTEHHNYVALHPKCVIEQDKNLNSPWLVFREKIKMTRVCLFDATSVPNYPLLLFGQKLIYNPCQKLINVDGFVKIKCSREIADVIRKLRQELDLLLQHKISHPDVTSWDSNTKEGRLLQTIVDLLTSEKMTPPVQYNDNNVPGTSMEEG